MEDVTNYINNVGKDVSRQTFQISVNYDELTLLKALAQNPHPEYQRHSETGVRFREAFEDLKRIVDSINERNERAYRKSPKPGFTLEDPFSD